MGRSSGIFGFYYKGKFYVVYNHLDSYPETLGALVARDIKAAGKEGIAKWKEAFDSGRMVILPGFEDRPKPTPDDVARLAPYTDSSSGNLDNWYVLTHKCQGSLFKVMKSGYLLNHVDEEGEPEWERYGYIVDLDKGEFHHYVGSRRAGRRRLEMVTATMFDDEEEEEEEDTQGAWPASWNWRPYSAARLVMPLSRPMVPLSRQLQSYNPRRW
jgi:hypothetical protein